MFWTQQGSYTHEFTAFVAAWARSASSSQTNCNLEKGGGVKSRPQLRSCWGRESLFYWRMQLSSSGGSHAQEQKSSTDCTWWVNGGVVLNLWVSARMPGGLHPTQTRSHSCIQQVKISALSRICNKTKQSNKQATAAAARTITTKPSPKLEQGSLLKSSNHFFCKTSVSTLLKLALLQGQNQSSAFQL